MEARALVLVLGWFLASPLGAAESPFIQAAEQLDGVWQGENFALRVDSARAQANVDQERPFRWQRFLVKEVTGETVVFTVGAELFEASLGQPGRLTLTSTSFRGERILERREPAQPKP